MKFMKLSKLNSSPISIPTIDRGSVLQEANYYRA